MYVSKMAQNTAALNKMLHIFKKITSALHKHID